MPRRLDKLKRAEDIILENLPKFKKKGELLHQTETVPVMKEFEVYLERFRTEPHLIFNLIGGKRKAEEIDKLLELA